MGKGILIVVAAFIISLMYYNVARYKSSVETTGQTASYQYTMLAQRAAKSGYALARQALFDGEENAVFTGSVPSGTYRTVLSKGGATYRIESQGRMRDTRSRPVVWTIYADYQRRPTATPTQVPPFLDYALISQGDLTLQGSPTTDLAAFGDAENANIHTNGTLSITGNNVEVSGFGTYSEGATSNPPKALETSFSPTNNELERPPVYEVPQIEIPEFSVADYLDKVVPDMISGDVTLSGDYNLGGTREDPFVWVINGDLDAEGGTTVDGYAMFLVAGNIHVAGNLSAGMGAEGSTESTLAFYADGNIVYKGTVDIYGQFFADGDFIVEGTPTLYGSVATRGSALLGGTPNLNYVEASPALAQIWNDGLDLYRLVSYYEAIERTAEDKTHLFSSVVK